MTDKNSPKNEFMTVRDPDAVIRGMLDELRLAEAGGTRIPLDRTATLKACLERCLMKINKPKQ